MKKDIADPLHSKVNIKSYGAYLDELTPDDVYDGLVGFGMFGNKVPPVLNSEKFLLFCQTKKCNFEGRRRPWLSFRYMRNFDLYRDFGIPDPFAHERLSAHIRDHWDEIKDVLKKNTNGDPYVVSKIHIRKLRNSRAIFDMNYNNWRTDYKPLPALLVGKKYIVSCDISTCFPSIYTHAVEWAICGKNVAKQKAKEKSQPWYAKLDALLRNTTYGETHGVLIGPHVSNLVSELILTSVDRKIMNEGFRFTRAIDDYSCYVETYELAEKFILALGGALQEYGLTLNQRKTRIEELPIAASSSWVRALRDFWLPDSELTYPNVSAFLDFAVELMKRTDDNRAVLLYAMRVISRHHLNYRARKYYLDMGIHLVCLYPYLMPHAESILFDPCHIEQDRLSILLELMYTKGLQCRDFLTSAFSLYYAIRYGITVDAFASMKEDMVQSEDCLLWLFSWLYAKENEEWDIANELSDKAKTFVSDDENFGRNWLFVYEVLDVADLPNGDWKKIKKEGVSFINSELLHDKSMIDNLES